MELKGNHKLIRRSGQLDAALVAIRTAGHNPGHFDFEVQPGTAGGEGKATRYLVQITNRTTGLGATLDGECWVEGLEAKLLVGEFG
jgi:hypothetical protein